MVELKPCPFCGDSASVSYWGSETQILCTNCNALSAAFGGPDAEAKAITAWNTRAILSTGDDAGLVELMELVERCQRIADYSETYRSGVAASCLREAAAAILSLTARNKELEEALRGIEQSAFVGGTSEAKQVALESIEDIARSVLNDQQECE